MKKPLPRAFPASIDATAGRAALTMSSIDLGALEEGAALSVTLVGRVSTMLPVNGGTNVSVDAGSAVAEAGG